MVIPIAIGKVEEITFEGYGLLADPQNTDRIYFVADGDFVDDVLSFDHTSEHRVFSVQPRCRFVGDEELAAS